MLVGPESAMVEHVALWLPFVLVAIAFALLVNFVKPVRLYVFAIWNVAVAACCPTCDKTLKVGSRGNSPVKTVTNSTSKNEYVEKLVLSLRISGMDQDAPAREASPPKLTALPAVSEETPAPLVDAVERYESQTAGYEALVSAREAEIEQARHVWRSNVEEELRKYCPADIAAEASPLKATGAPSASPSRRTHSPLLLRLTKAAGAAADSARAIMAAVSPKVAGAPSAAFAGAPADEKVDKVMV